MTSRRDFFKTAGVAGGAIAAAAVSRVAMAALPEPVIQTQPDTMPPLVPSTGRPYNAVVTLNGWTLPWRMNQGVKEFHLVAEPVVREMALGMKAHLWGYNGQSPGPTIEVVEGDRVRILSPINFLSTPVCIGMVSDCPMVWMVSQALTSPASLPGKPLSMSLLRDVPEPSCTTRMRTR